jgi:acyl carrier protein
LDERLAALVRRHLRAPDGQELRPQSSLRELGLDSLRAVRLLLDVEEEFAVTLPDSSLATGSLETPAALWAAIVAAGRSGAG